VVDLTLKYEFAEDRGVVVLFVNAIVDEDSDAEQASLALATAKAASLEAFRQIDVVDVQAPDFVPEDIVPPTNPPSA
jgi:hypothetical protein